MELTIKQEQFAQLVATGKTYSDAYREAYNCAKMSKNAIYVESSRLMDNPKIALFINQIREENLERNQVSLDEVLKEMSNWLRFDPAKLFDENYAVKPFAELPEGIRKCISSFEVVEQFEGRGKDRRVIGYLKKIRLIDKRAVSDQFLKKFGAYVNSKVTVEMEEDLSYLEDILARIENR